MNNVFTLDVWVDDDPDKGDYKLYSFYYYSIGISCIDVLDVLVLELRMMLRKLMFLIVNFLLVREW